MIQLMHEWLKQNEGWIIETRRLFHQFPELSRKEFATNQRIRKILTEHNIDYLAPENNITIAIVGKKGDQTIAFRCDTDALNIVENTGLSFASKNHGVMHACGHDAHIAIGLAAVCCLKHFEDKLSKRIFVIFQPAEEGARGAQAVIDTGLLHNVKQFYALHVWPDLPVGTIGLKAGSFFSGTDKITIRLRGKSGHAAVPDSAQDTIAATGALIQSLQHIVSRFISPKDAGVITIGRIDAGNRWNIIADTSLIEGTVRVVEPNVRKNMLEAIEEMTQLIAKAHRCESEFQLDVLSSIIINDELETKQASEAALLADIKAKQVPPQMVGDDFAEYRQIAPGCYVLLGAQSDDGSYYPLHHGKFSVNERALYHGAAWFCSLALMKKNEN